MTESSSKAQTLRFGVYAVRFPSGELLKNGFPVRVQEKPLKALSLLLERAGQTVTRDEFRDRLWGGDTFVEFDDSLHHVIKKVRDALGDSATNPHFIETMPGRGYRFICPIETQYAPVHLPEAGTPDTSSAVVRPSSRTLTVLAASAVALALVALAVVLATSPRQRPESSLNVPAFETKPSVVVLPFANLTGDPEQDYFADATTDLLINELGKIGALRVISRTSAMRYKGSSNEMPPLAEIGKQLNVSHVVEGAVIRSEGRIRVTAQLVAVETDEHLWSQNYVAELGSIGSLPNEVAKEVVKAVQVELTPEEEIRLAAVRPVSPEVYKAFVAGRALARAGDTRKARMHFQEAIAIDPDYAPAYSWLAGIYIQMSWWMGPPAEFATKARKAALRAIELDPSLAQPHLLLGKIRAFYDWEWEEAEQHYLKALELNPNHTEAYLSYALYLAVVKRFSEARRMAERAVELDPLSPWTLGTAGHVEYYARDLERGVALLNAAVEMQPDAYVWQALLGCAMTTLGRHEDSLAHLKRAIPGAGQDLKPKMLLAYHYAGAGKREEALKILFEVERAPPVPNASRYLRAVAYGALGDFDRAFDLLDQAVEERWGFLGTVTIAPPFDTIRAHPRYAVLLKRIGLDGRQR